MSEHALGRANQIWSSRLLAGESDDDGGRIGQRHPAGEGRPSSEWRTLQAEEAEQAEVFGQFKGSYGLA